MQRPIATALLHVPATTHEHRISGTFVRCDDLRPPRTPVSPFGLQPIIVDIDASVPAPAEGEGSVTLDRRGIRFAWQVDARARSAWAGGATAAWFVVILLAAFAELSTQRGCVVTFPMWTVMIGAGTLPFAILVVVYANGRLRNATRQSGLAIGAAHVLGFRIDGRALEVVTDGARPGDSDDTVRTAMVWRLQTLAHRLLAFTRAIQSEPDLAGWREMLLAESADIELEVTAATAGAPQLITPRSLRHGRADDEDAWLVPPDVQLADDSAVADQPQLVDDAAWARRESRRKPAAGRAGGWRPRVSDDWWVPEPE